MAQMLKLPNKKMFYRSYDNHAPKRSNTLETNSKTVSTESYKIINKIKTIEILELKNIITQT